LLRTTQFVKSEANSHRFNNCQRVFSRAGLCMQTVFDAIWKCSKHQLKHVRLLSGIVTPLDAYFQLYSKRKTRKSKHRFLLTSGQAVFLTRLRHARAKHLFSNETLENFAFKAYVSVQMW